MPVLEIHKTFRFVQIYSFSFAERMRADFSAKNGYILMFTDHRTPVLPEYVSYYNIPESRNRKEKFKNY